MGLFLDLLTQSYVVFHQGCLWPDGGINQPWAYDMQKIHNFNLFNSLLLLLLLLLL